MTLTFDDEATEHECPRPLADQVAEFDVGGMFLSPAGRWETVTDRTPHGHYSARVTIHTDKTGDGYAWTFWRSDKFPYLPGWLMGLARQVAVFELHHAYTVEVTNSRGAGRGHTLLTARMVRGSGWQISDAPDGTTAEYVTLPSKARARAEVTRRARAHAKRLDIALRPAAAPCDWA